MWEGVRFVWVEGGWGEGFCGFVEHAEEGGVFQLVLNKYDF